jgi:pimeloyl-ACP methyl ester carboxylesterase
MSEHAHVDGVYPFPAVMQTRTIETNGTSIHVRVGGHGPAVVMLHGFGTTGDMWGHLASALIEDHMVVAPDLRGLGLSSKPDGGYDKKNQAADVMGVLDALGVRTAELVTHDIGIMVGFAVAATHPERVSRWVAIDAPLPGVGPWDQITQDPAMWHYRERRHLDLYNGVAIPKPSTFDDDLKGWPGKPKCFIEAKNKIGTWDNVDGTRSLEEVAKDYYAGLVAVDDMLGRLSSTWRTEGSWTIPPSSILRIMDISSVSFDALTSA